MASAIDATKPVAGNPTTQSVRDNFGAAASEITALQAATVPTPVTIPQGGTGATNAATALTNLGIIATAPTRQVFTSGSGTYTRPAGVKWIEVECQGAGGGAGGNGTGATAGGAGGATTFGAALTANGGGASLANSAAGASGGTATGGNFNVSGSVGRNGNGVLSDVVGPPGGGSFFGDGGRGGSTGGGGGSNAQVPGGGGGGTGSSTTLASTGGGGSGGYCRLIIGSPAATYAYAVGAGGTFGTAGSSGFTGGGGAAGIIIVTEHYNF